MGNANGTTGPLDSMRSLEHYLNDLMRGVGGGGGGSGGGGGDTTADQFKGKQPSPKDTHTHTHNATNGLGNIFPFI